VDKDLKRENILLYEKKTIKITDFGLRNVMGEGEFVAR